MRRTTLFFFALLGLLFCGLSSADNAFLARPDVQRFINAMVQKQGFNKQQLTHIFGQVVIQPQIIESMTRPFEQKPWDVYKQLFLTDERLQSGIDFWRANQQALAKAEKKYGVPAQIIVAILGVETRYGKNQGNYRVLDALSTLAFNYPPRSPFFTKELEQFLLLCREQKVSPLTYLGSYAGAIGKPQFMPSSYRSYAANFNGGPKKDLINDDEAVIASVANYFHKHGWRQFEGVAQPAKITGSQYKQINTTFRTAVYTPSQLAKVGIKPITAANRQPNKSGLIKLVSSINAEYWLAYPNFYVITRYNTSPQYAMTVYLFSLQLKKQWVAQSGKRKFAYV